MRLLLDTHVFLWAEAGSPLLTLPTRRLMELAGVARLADHHRDPFGRLLLAQAIAEPLRLLTADKVLQNCSDLLLPIRRKALAIGDGLGVAEGDLPCVGTRPVRERPPPTLQRADSVGGKGRRPEKRKGRSEDRPRSE